MGPPQLKYLTFKESKNVKKNLKKLKKNGLNERIWPKKACIIAKHESNSEDPFPLTYQKLAQSNNKNLYQKYPTHLEMTEKQQKK